MAKLILNPNSIYTNSQANFVLNKEALYAFTRSVSAINNSVYGMQPTRAQLLTGFTLSDVYAVNPKDTNYSLCATVDKMQDGIDVMEVSLSALKFFATKPFEVYDSVSAMSADAKNPLALYLTPIFKEETETLSVYKLRLDPDNETYWTYVSQRDIDEWNAHPEEHHNTPVWENRQYVFSGTVTEKVEVKTTDHYEWIYVLPDTISSWEQMEEIYKGEYYLSSLSGEWELVGSTSFTDDKLSNIFKDFYNTLISAVSQEKAERVSADDELDRKIDDTTENIRNEISVISSVITADVEDKYDYLNEKIDKEIQDRISSDEALHETLHGEISAVSSEITSVVEQALEEMSEDIETLSNDLCAEISARISADDDLKNTISTISSELTAVDDALCSNIEHLNARTIKMICEEKDLSGINALDFDNDFKYTRDPLIEDLPGVVSDNLLSVKVVNVVKGQEYTLQDSIDLVNWSDILTFNADKNFSTIITFTNPDGTFGASILTPEDEIKDTRPVEEEDFVDGDDIWRDEDAEDIHPTPTQTRHYRIAPDSNRRFNSYVMLNKDARINGSSTKPVTNAAIATELKKYVPLSGGNMTNALSVTKASGKYNKNSAAYGQNYIGFQTKNLSAGISSELILSYPTDEGYFKLSSEENYGEKNRTIATREWVSVKTDELSNYLPLSGNKTISGDLTSTHSVSFEEAIQLLNQSRSLKVDSNGIEMEITVPAYQSEAVKTTLDFEGIDYKNNIQNANIKLLYPYTENQKPQETIATREWSSEKFATKEDATLSTISQFGEWTCEPADDGNGHSYDVSWDVYSNRWTLSIDYGDTTEIHSGPEDINTTSFIARFNPPQGSITIVTATRKEKTAYVLGSQTDKPLAPAGDYALKEELNVLSNILSDYAQLSNIPVVNDGTFSISCNGQEVGTFSANQENDSGVNIELPSVGDGTLTINYNGNQTETFSANQSSSSSITIDTPNDGTLDIQVNESSVGTFTANQSGNTTVNIDLSEYATTADLNTLENTVEGLSSDLKNVKDAVDAAQQTANNAKDTADRALTDAFNAQQAASNAQLAANGAENTANTALNTANTAQTTATTAQSTATQAQNTADNAQTVATNAYDTANSAQSTANNAYDIATTSWQVSEALSDYLDGLSDIYVRRLSGDAYDLSVERLSVDDTFIARNSDHIGFSGLPYGLSIDSNQTKLYANEILVDKIETDRIDSTFGHVSKLSSDCINLYSGYDGINEKRYVGRSFYEDKYTNLSLSYIIPYEEDAAKLNNNASADYTLATREWVSANVSSTIALSDYIKKEDLCAAILPNISQFNHYLSGDIPYNINSIIEWNKALHTALLSCCGILPSGEPPVPTAMSRFYFTDGSVSVENIVGEMDDRYKENTSLSAVELGTAVTSIGDYAFQDCDGLTSITIPDSVTSIGDSAFYGCPELTSITIPDGVTSIGYDTFGLCPNLSSITSLAAIAPTVKSDTFGDSDSISYTGRNTYSSGNNVLKVPQGATGYDSEAWLDPLQNADKCGFHIEYIS